jgi:hypothetical protein
MNWLVEEAVAYVLEAMDLYKQVPPKYHQFLSIFDKQIPDAFPPHHCFNFAINLKERK